MGEQAQGLALVLGACAALGLAILGIGTAVHRCFGARLDSLLEIGAAFWTGFAALLLALCGVSLFLAIDAHVTIAVLVAGLAALVLVPGWRAALARRPGPILPLLGFGAAVAVAHQASGPLRNADTVYYHYAAVRWAAEHPVTPGLGNLNIVLGHNSSFFLYAAMFESGPLAGRGFHLANALLLMACVWLGLAEAGRLVRGNAVPQAFWMLAWPVMLSFIAYNSSSLSPDLAAFVLSFLLARLTFDVLSNPTSELGLFRLILTAVAAVTVKLTAAVLALACIALGAWHWRRRPGPAPGQRHGPLLGFCLFVGAAGAAWSLRGLLLSGCLVFPLAASCAPVEWRVPEQTVVEAGLWIKSWARSPYQAPAVVLGNGAWFAPWLKRSLGAYPEMWLPLLLWLGVSARALRRGTHRTWVHAWLCVGATAIAFWFVSAPDPRFGAGLFWALAAGAVSIDLPSEPRARAAGLVYMGLCLALALRMLARGHFATHGPGSDSGLWPVTRPPFREFVTSSGLRLAVPVGPGCYDAALCTPVPDDAIEARDPRDPARGFRIRTRK